MDDHDEDEFVFVTLEECSSRAANTNSGGDYGDWLVLVPTPRSTAPFPPSPPSLLPLCLSHASEVTTHALRANKSDNEDYNACEFANARHEEEEEEEKAEEEGECPDFEALSEDFENHCQRENRANPLDLDSAALHNMMDIYVVGKRCGTNTKMDLLGNRARRRHAYMSDKYWTSARNALDTYLF